MSSTTFVNMRVNNAEQFKNSISDTIANTNLYLTFGKVTAWPDEANPNTANAAVATVYEVWANMIGGKKLVGSDIVHVVPRFNWTANTKYIAYDHMNTNMYDGNTKFYVLTSDYNVYKCISNASSSNSTVEPQSVNPGSLTYTSDGYVWKYMYTVSDSDQLRFLTSQYMPVRKITNDDGSLQWQVQSSVIPGKIDSIVVLNGGSNYTDPSNTSVLITGDGTSAAANVTVNSISKTISSITMTDYGYGFTFANATITAPAGSGAVLKPIISPPGGHGSNPLYELGGAALMINGIFKNTEDGYFPVTNDYRQIAIIKNPQRYTDSTIASNSKVLQAYTLTTVGTGDYQLDEAVYQGGSLAASSFSGRIVSWDSSNGKAVIINTVGTPTSQSLVGSNTSTSRFVSNVSYPELVSSSGMILYVDNVQAISRASDQTEDFKILIKF